MSLLPIRLLEVNGAIILPQGDLGHTLVWFKSRSALAGREFLEYPYDGPTSHSRSDSSAFILTETGICLTRHQKAASLEVIAVDIARRIAKELG